MLLLCCNSSKEIFNDDRFGSAPNRLWLDSLSCTGNEADIDACLPNWKTNCVNGTSVGLSCGMFFSGIKIF